MAFTAGYMHEGPAKEFFAKMDAANVALKAMDAGLRYVYTGNVHDRSGGATHCPGCGRPVIERDWYEILTYCEHSGAAIAGRFGHFGRPFGSRRIPVSLHAR